MQDDPASGALRAVGRERLDQSGAELLPGQLHQAQRGHLRNLMTGAVTGQRLGQPTQHQVAVGLQHPVDEVDHDDAAEIAQPQLTHNLLGSLKIVLGDGLLQVAARTGELAGVDVDHRHGLGAIDHQRATRGQPDLAVHRLGQLLVDAVHREHIRAVGVLVLGQLRKQLGCNGIDVSVDGFPRTVAGDGQAGEVFIEQVPDDLYQDVGLLVERDRGPGLLGFDLFGARCDRVPVLLQPVDVAADVVFLHTLRGGPDDDAGIRGHDLAQDLLESLALGVGELAADTGR